MGINTNGAALLLQAKQEGACFDRILTIGHLYLYVTLRQLERFAKRLNLAIDLPAVAQDAFADTFLRHFLGATSVECMDYSDYEGCTIIHDMNYPVDPAYHQRYDAVIDGGALEHIFSFPTAVANCMNMLKPGGALFVFTMCNNHTGHGFYQFSPELFFRLLDQERGFRMQAVILEQHPFPSSELTENRKCYSVIDPASLRTRVGLVCRMPVLMMVHAVKIAHKALFSSYPIQSDYQLAYTRTGDTAPAQGGRGNVRRVAKALIRKLPPTWQNYFIGMNELRTFSFKNKRFYRPWKPF